jgi:hypothetical protein
MAMVAGLMLAAGGPAWAASLKEKKIIKQENEDLDRYFKEAHDACGTSFKTTIDWTSFKGELAKAADGKLADKNGVKLQSSSFSYFCAAPAPKAFVPLCGDDDGKKAVKAKVKQYVCKFGGEGKSKAQLKGGTLTVWIDWNAYDFHTTKEYLESNL